MKGACHKIELDIIADSSTYVSRREGDRNFCESDILKMNGSYEEHKEIFIRFSLKEIRKLKNQKNLTVKMGLRNSRLEKPFGQNAFLLLEDVDCKQLTYHNSRNLEYMEGGYEFDMAALKNPPFYCDVNPTPWVLADITDLFTGDLGNRDYITFRICGNVSTSIDSEYCSVIQSDRFDIPHRDSLVQAKYKPRIFVSYEANTEEQLKKEDEYQTSVRRLPLQRPSLLYTKEELPDICKRIERIPDLKKKYIMIKAAVDKYDIDRLEENFKLPRWEGFLNLHDRKPFLFDAPAEARTATVQIIIKGTADVLVDHAEFSELTGRLLVFDNGDFEKGNQWPSDWKFTSKSDTTVFHWQDTQVKGERAYTGRRSVRIVNKNRDDMAVLEYLVPFPVNPGVRYKFDCKLNYAEAFSDAAYLKVAFHDNAGRQIGTVTSHPENNPYENRPTEVWEYAMNAAVVYMKEGGVSYATGAKRLLFLMLTSLLNVLIKIETGVYWSFFQTIGVQTIHTSHYFMQCAIIYDVIADSIAISESEDNELREKMYEAMDYLKNGISFSACHHNSKGNMNCCRAAALAIGALVLKDDVRAGEYYEYGLSQMKYVLDHNFRYDEDGSWKETENYNWAVMEPIFILGIAMLRDRVLNTSEENLFLYKDILRKNMIFLSSIAGPRDQYNSVNRGSSLYPGVGDSGWTSKNKYYLLAYAYKDIDPALASRLMLSWERMGGKIEESNYDILALLFLDYGIPTRHAVIHDFIKSEKFDGRGLCIFRQNVGRPEEDYIVMTYTDRKAGHSHDDMGGLSIYLGGIPICVDPGVDGYSSGSWPYYISAASHSLVTFDNLTPDNGFISDSEFFISDSLDYAVLDTGLQDASVDVYRRHLAFVKNGHNMIIIWDDTRARKETVCTFRLATMTDEKSIVLNGNKFTGDLLADNRKQVEVVMLEPAEEVRCRIQKVKNPQSGFPKNEDFSYQNYIEIESKRENLKFLTLICLKEKEQMGLTAERMEMQSPHVFGYDIRKEGKRCFILVINNGNREESVRLPVTGNYKNLKTEEIASGDVMVMPDSIGIWEQYY